MRLLVRKPAVPIFILLANSGLQVSGFINLTVAIVLWVVAGLWLVASVVLWVKWGKIMRIRFRSPFVLSSGTGRQIQVEYQWFLDMAEKQRENPTTHLVITDRIIMDVQLEARRPLLRLRVVFANYGVNDLVMSNPVGYPEFGNERSSEYILDEGGQHNVPAGNIATAFNLDIYIPEAFLDDVRKEVESPSGEVRGKSLGQLRAKVRAKGEGSPEVVWGIGDPRSREIFRPNRRP